MSLRNRLIPKLCATNKGGNEARRDAFQVDAVFAHRYIAGQMILVHAAKGAQKIACASPEAFCGIDVNLTNAIAIIIACPFVFTMIDRNPLALNLIVAIPFIGIRHSMGSGKLSHVSL